jgi:dephospho-CoA kinase
MKIAIAGGIATGKTTVASALSERFSIPRISFSGVLRHHCKKIKLNQREMFCKN